MEPKQLMLLAAAAVGAYVLFFRGNGTASNASTSAPAPSSAVTGGYSSPAIVGLPVPQVSSGLANPVTLFVRPDPTVLQAQAAATTAAYAASGFEGHTEAPQPAVAAPFFSNIVQPNGQYII